MERFILVTQARIESSRFHGKILKEIEGYLNSLKTD